MTLNVLAEPSQLKPVSFCPSTVLLSVWMICAHTGGGGGGGIVKVTVPRCYYQRLEGGGFWCSIPRWAVLYLDINLVVCGPVYRAVQAKAHHEYPPVY